MELVVMWKCKLRLGQKKTQLGVNYEETDRWKDKDFVRQTDTNKSTDIRKKHRLTKTDRQRLWPTDRQTQTETDRKTYRGCDRQRDWRTGRQRDR